MATFSNKTYPQKSNGSQVNYNYEYFDYDSCTQGMSSDEEEEIDNFFFNECVDDEINNNRSDDSQTDINVEDDIDFSSAPAPKKKTNLYKEGRGSTTMWPYHPLNQYCLLMLMIIKI